MQNNRTICYTLTTLDGGPRPAVFLFDGGNREPLLEAFDEIVGNVQWDPMSMSKALNNFAATEPKMRFHGFEHSKSDDDSRCIELIGTRKGSTAGIRIAFSR